MLSRIPFQFHDFIYDCYKLLHLRKVSEIDIDKFLIGKSPLSDNQIQQRLSIWLQDKLPVFLPRYTDKLLFCRIWDHKIELISGKELLYFKNRFLSLIELVMVCKWLDDNFSKGFIRESKSQCASPLLFLVGG
ncbi:hypothetical protein OCU04_004999 [Sclerotinia nivalis]|uniref:Uncharacterized protein n=1 Tax=Sclerotinia nivalis TaxID=352851 RepID=A0A9X0DMD4_9HELO|nr:hypothetical protein OCU04_004999 [Sclerotinia nivalis]